jgi:hypothetical protein
MLRLSTADWFAWVTVILSGTAAAGGLFGRNLYRDNPFWIEQTRGIDLATLFLAVPILVVSLILVAGGWRLAVPLELGVLLYLAYNYAIYTTSVAMNRFALLYIAVLGLSLWAAILLASSPSLALASRTLTGTSHGRVAAIFLLVVAALFGLLWLSQILSSTLSGALPVDLKRTGLPANPVYALDLAVFLPLAVIAAIGVLRNLSPAADFALPMLVWVVLTSAGIVGGFFFEARANETVPIPVAALIGLLGVLAMILTGLALQAANRTV